MELIRLENDRVKAVLSARTAALVNLQVPDREGRWTEVIVPAPGFSGMQSRISGPAQNQEILLDQEVFTVAEDPWNERLFQVQEQSDDMAVFTLTSPDGEGGFPGRMEITVTWRLLEDGIQAQIRGTADRTTVFDPACSTAFCLGDPAGTVGHHVLTVEARRFLPADGQGIPTGEIRNGKNTPFDFTEPRCLIEALDSRHPQLRAAGGLNHGFCLDTVTECVLLFCPATGIEMSIDTTLPLVKITTLGSETSLTPASLGIRTGFADDETHIDPCHARSILQAGEVYEATTAFRFRTYPAA